MGLEKRCSKKDQVEAILAQFLKDPSETSSKRFYERQSDQLSSIKLNVLEEIVSLVFKYQKKQDQKHNQIVTNLIQMLKSGGGFIQYLTDHPQFDKSLIFNFFEATNIDENILSVFGEIFVTLARSNPAKMMEMLKNQDIQNIFIRNLKRGEVMNIIYTAIFCLNETESLNHKKFISAVLRVLLMAPFEDNDGNSIFSHCICYDDSNVTKQEQVSQPPKSKQQKKQSFCKKDCLNPEHPFFTPSDNQFYQQVITSTSNLADMFEQIYNNVQVIHLGNVQILIDLILENCYMKDLFSFLIENQKQGRANKPELSSEIWRVIHGILIVVKAWATTKSKPEFDDDFKQVKRVRKQSISEILQSNEQSEVQTVENSKLMYSQQNHLKLFKVCQNITRYLQLCYQQYVELRQSKKNESSLGANIERVGLSKYNILKIHFQILDIIQHTNFSIQKKFGLKAALPSLLPLVIQCMKASKWNNITINLIVRIIRQYTKVCYGNFYHYAINLDKVSKGFLGFLIENFRNKYHIFLNSMKFCPQGDHYSIYLMSKDISSELHLNRDLLWLFNKFPQWKIFMQNDLQQYQHLFFNKNYFNEKMLQPVSAKLIKSTSLIGNEDMQNIQRGGSSVEEINQFYRENWDWCGQNKHAKLKTKNLEAPSSQQQKISQLNNKYNSL